MSKKIKSITNPKLSLKILAPQEVQRIHEATLAIIEKVGVRFPSRRAACRGSINSTVPAA